jgi:hypothetical protein
MTDKTSAPFLTVGLIPLASFVLCCCLLVVVVVVVVVVLFC